MLPPSLWLHAPASLALLFYICNNLLVQRSKGIYGKYVWCLFLYRVMTRLSFRSIPQLTLILLLPLVISPTNYFEITQCTLSLVLFALQKIWIKVVRRTGKGDSVGPRLPELPSAKMQIGLVFQGNRSMIKSATPPTSRWPG